jgi:hypothetical protein
MFVRNNPHIRILGGGKLLGRGKDKCAYDHTEVIMCRTKTKPRKVPIKRDRVALVMERHVYQEEKKNAKMLTKRVPKDQLEQVCTMLDSRLACSDTIAPLCNKVQEKDSKLVTATAQRGSTRCKFKTMQDLGYALANLVYALWVFKSHGLVHNDIKLENLVLVEDKFGHQVFKMIDMSSMHTRSGVEERIRRADKAFLEESQDSSYCFPKAHGVWMSRRGLVGKLLKKHQVDQQSVMEVLIDNIDMFRFALCVDNLRILNPKLDVKSIQKRLVASPGDFAHNPNMYRARLVVNDLCEAGLGKTKQKPQNESFATLQAFYSTIISTCKLDLPPVLSEYRHAK